jgi:hypothetical protein
MAFANRKESLMLWYQSIGSFFAGMFFANVVPHFVHGISGDRFPTPFADPPGKGLSSPTVNVVWALLNLAVGYILFRAGKVSTGGYSAPRICLTRGVQIENKLGTNYRRTRVK